MYEIYITHTYHTSHITYHISHITHTHTHTHTRDIAHHVWKKIERDKIKNKIEKKQKKTKNKLNWASGE